MTVDIIPEWFPKDKVCIVGYGQTEYTPWGKIGRPELAIALQAIIKAVGDAGLQMKDIDGLCSYSDERNDPATLATALGLPHLRLSNKFWGGGGGGGCGSIMNSALAIAYGYANYVVVYHALSQNPFGRFALGPGTKLPGSMPSNMLGAVAFSMPWGAFTSTHQYALQARRHMHLYGTQSKHFGMIASACYKHASQNPAALMRPHGPLTIEEHQNSEMIDDPIRFCDCALESDGAVAVVLTSADRARSLKQRPVYITAASQGSGFRQTAGAYNKVDFDSSNFSQVSADLWKRAGVTPKDIDVVQVCENTTPMVLMSLEDHGFCQRGEGGAFVEGGRIEGPAGKLPVNTGGGSIAEANIHGFEAIIEGIKQMRGNSTCQVKDAEYCLVTGSPGISPVSEIIIRR
ncbi:MAG: hypothetical protein HYX83_04910 [Chloroflexi bacterium]|nr:hypothetical protein [Chloroflexota bacterium]